VTRRFGDKAGRFGNTIGRFGDKTRENQQTTVAYIDAVLDWPTSLQWFY